MAQLIKPVQTKVVTKDGECQIAISLEVTINLNSDGLVSASAVPVIKPKEEPEEEEGIYEIPDFSVSKEKINFGK